MATLTKCPFCGAVMPKDDTHCPSCAVRVKPLIGPFGIAALLVLVVVVAIVAWNLG